MNYLAHVYLSDGSPESVLGGLLADFVRSDADYSPAIRAGIVLHRKIDAFTNAHPVFIQSKRRIGTPWTPYAEVLVDLFYDHYLAANWPHYSEQPLAEYVTTIHAILHQHFAILPPAMQISMKQMLEENWLLSYKEVAGMEGALTRISRRLKRKVELHRAIEALQRAYGPLGADFALFFPEAATYARSLH